MAKIVRKYFRNIDYEIDEENQVLRLLKPFHDKLLGKSLSFGRGFKKVGGSALGDFLLTDAYKSRFSAFCYIANLALPVLDEKYVRAGRIIESKVIEVIKSVTKETIQTFDPEAYQYDYFKQEDPIIGGVPDAFNQKTKTLIEIKTTGINNFPKWLKDGPPVAYIKQASQYAYLMKVERFSIVATFLLPEDYENPDLFPINARRIKNWNFKVDIAQVEDDITQIKQLYQTWTQTGVSPKYSEKINKDLLEWLKCENIEQWEELAAKWIASGKYVV